jgi:hypothetical protein
VEIQRRHHGIAQLQGELPSLKESRNWYCYRYLWAVNDFLGHGILIPWGSAATTANQDMGATTAGDDDLNQQWNSPRDVSFQILWRMLNMFHRRAAVPLNYSHSHL